MQGIDTPLAQEYVARMMAYGTQIVAGVSAGYSDETSHDIPVFSLVATAKQEVGEDLTTSLIFVDAFDVLDAALEAIAAGIKQLVIISGGVPPLDMVKLFQKAEKQNVRILGPGSNGLVIPDQLWLGTGVTRHFQAGEIAILSRFGSLAQEAAIVLNAANLGQSCIIDVGNSQLLGSGFSDWVKILDADPKTKAIALLGRYCSREEVEMISFVQEQIKTQVITYLCGKHTPLYNRCQKADTIIANHLSYCLHGTYSEPEMVKAFRRKKLAFARSLEELPTLIKKAITPPKSRNRRKAKTTSK